MIRSILWQSIAVNGVVLKALLIAIRFVSDSYICNLSLHCETEIRSMSVSMLTQQAKKNGDSYTYSDSLNRTNRIYNDCGNETGCRYGDGKHDIHHKSGADFR